MLYSIIIPIVKINSYLKENVGAIQSLNYEKWELIVVTDFEEASEWVDPRITLIASGKVSPARKRDMAAKISRGDVLVFLDDDSYPSDNLLDVANKYFCNPDCVGIGGPGVTPSSDSLKQKASGAVFETKVLGGSPERYISTGITKRIDDWPSVNFMVRKFAFEMVSGFDTDYWPGEDTILCQKLVDEYPNGLWYAPDLIVWHHRRESLQRHAKQVYRYGLHRGYFVRSGVLNSIRFKFFLPSVLIIGLAVSFIAMVHDYEGGLQLLLPIIYGVAILIGFIEIVKLNGLRIGMAAIPYVLITHICYGAGFLVGILKKNLVSRLR